jgi:hypothetical protein
MAEKLDKELEQYRQLMTVPSVFGEGFSLGSFLGVLFVALVMVPGAIYMDLVMGASIGGSASWVTVILFAEVAKRANAKLSRPTLYVLFYMSGGLIGGAVYDNLLFNQFLIHSDAATSTGISRLIPSWVAPSDPEAYSHRTFWQLAWMPALGLWLFKRVFGKLDNMVLGYGLFRLTSDIERLPFPMAPVGAQGMMAIAEDLEGQAQSSWRWRVFSIGGALGMAFAAVYGFLPMVTGAWLDGSVYSIFPIPWVDWTHYTQNFLPATATGMAFDLGLVIGGMVMPYSAMLGTFVGAMFTLALNPILYHFHVLRLWAPGDDTIQTSFLNSLDFYFSFGIGLSLAVAFVGFLAILKVRKTRQERTLDSEELPKIPAGRGDIPTKWVMACYLISTVIYVLVCGYLVDWHRGVMVVLLFFGFVYTPIISYVSARLVGMVGQTVEIPYIRELSFILSGYKGVGVWFMPLPMNNYGSQTMSYRQAELTGTRFPSLWKADFFLFPIIIIGSICFASFVYGLAEIPSSVYPNAAKTWELSAKNQILIISSTTGEYSQFQQALSFVKISIGFVIGVSSFWILGLFSAPRMLCYGLVGGIGQMPHYIILQFVGALLGRYYFEKKLGLRWREYIPVMAAGYGCGGGLIMMFAMGLVFLSKSSSSLPY